MLDHIYDISYIITMNITANNLFSTLSNEIRLRCLLLLHHQGELCVCELTHALELSQPMISRHLALLRDAGLVEDRRAGQWIFYSVHSDLDDWAKDILTITSETNSQQQPYVDDLKTLLAMPDRPDAICCG